MIAPVAMGGRNAAQLEGICTEIALRSQTPDKEVRASL